MSRKITLIDKINKPGYSALGGELFIKCNREDGTPFLKPLEKNATMMGGAQNYAAKMLGLDLNNGQFTNLNEMDNFAVYKLDQEATLKLLETVESLGNTPIIFGIAFGKEGATSQARDKVFRYEKGYSIGDLLPIKYYRTEAEDTNIANNYENGYCLRSVENGKVKYYGLKTKFKGYGRIIGGEKLGSVGYPADLLKDTSLSCEYIIETEVTVSAEFFKDYFIYDQQNGYGRLFSSVKVLSGIPTKVTNPQGGTVLDWRNITVTNVVPTTTIHLEKDEEITIVYRQYF